VVTGPNSSGDGFPVTSKRLPAGRHGLPPDVVKANQRERIMAALAELVTEKGYGDTTVADITAKAALSRRTFYEHFKSKEDCFLAAYNAIIDHVHGLMAEASASEPEWAGKVIAGLSAMLRFYASEPVLARLAFVESRAAGQQVAERYRREMTWAARTFDAGREQRASEESMTETLEESVVGGLVSLVARQVTTGKIAELEELLPDLVELTLTPYVGVEEAQRLARHAA
jgi:AcrR family transcriptional regulator